MQSSIEIKNSTTSSPVLISWFSELNDKKNNNAQFVQDSLVHTIEFKAHWQNKPKNTYLGKWKEGRQFQILQNFLIHAKTIRDFHLVKNKNLSLIGNLNNYIEGMEQLCDHWQKNKSSSFTIGIDLIYLLTRSLRGRTHKDLQKGFEHLRAKNKKLGDSKPMFEVNTPAERDFLLLIEKYFHFFAMGSVWYGYFLSGLLSQLKNQFQKKLDNYFRQARDFNIELKPQENKSSADTEIIMLKIAETKNNQFASLKPLSKGKSYPDRIVEDKKPFATLKPLQKNRELLLPVKFDSVKMLLTSMGATLDEKDLSELLKLNSDEIEEALYHFHRY